MASFQSEYFFFIALFASDQASFSHFTCSLGVLLTMKSTMVNIPFILHVPWMDESDDSESERDHEYFRYSLKDVIFEVGGDINHPVDVCRF
jgi:hypothetical protein